MNKYEIALVLNPKYEEEERTAVMEKVKGYVDRFGGTITNIDEWGKKRLAYEIDKVNEGYYFFIKMDAPADAPAEIEKRLRITEPILRYLVIREEA